MKKHLFTVGFLCVCMTTLALADPPPGPSWWVTRGVMNTNQSPSDYKPMNQGQLKWLVSNAYVEVSEKIGPGTNLAAVLQFSNTNNYLPVNLGQVKRVVAPFYDRLNEFGLTNCMPSGMLGPYPWSGAPQTNDYAMANIGQIKRAFSFDLSDTSAGGGLGGAGGSGIIGSWWVWNYTANTPIVDGAFARASMTVEKNANELVFLSNTPNSLTAVGVDDKLFIKVDGGAWIEVLGFGQNKPINITSYLHTGRNQLEFKATNVGGPWAVTTMYLVKVVPQVSLKSVIFRSDHGVLTDYNSDFGGSGGTVYSPRGWVKGGANNPVSHTRYQNVLVNVVVCAKPAGISLSLSGTGTVPGLSFPGTAFTSTGSDQTIPLTSSQPLLLRVDILNESVSWATTVSGGTSCSIGSSGPHKVYVTCGTPGAGPTLKRINFACEKAQFCGTYEQCADAILNAMPGNFGNPVTSYGWQVLDGGKAECIGLADCMHLVVEMLGIGAELKKVRASTNAGAGNCLDFEERLCSAHGREKLMLMFPDWPFGTTAFPNECEGCCLAAGKYYAVYSGWKGNPKRKANDDYDMLKKLASEEGVYQCYGLLTASGNPSGYLCSQPDAQPNIP